MASTDKSADPEVTTKEEAPPPPPPSAAPCFYHFAVDVALRALLFAAALTSVVVMVTGDQTVLVPVPNVPGVTVPLPAKFKYSPAFVYFVAALSVAGFYSIITILASISFFLKPACFRKFLVYFAFWDVLLLGVVASATGAAGAIGYTGLKGNKHVNWGEVCSTLDKFCQHVGSSTAVALFASVLLLLLSFLSIFSLHKRIRD